MCDSFKGLPPGNRNLDAADKNWDHTSYLEVSDEMVQTNFCELGLADPGVVFVKGFFNDSMPFLAKHIQNISVLRLDGDMYESTVDVLYHLYGKLAVGGYAIMDDWKGFPSRTACLDFFAVHGFQPDIIPIDTLSVYWRKKSALTDADVQYWRYQQNKFV